MAEVKAIGGQYLYNMLQDFRHIVVFDLRQANQFVESKIRDSFHISNELTRCTNGSSIENISQVVNFAIKKSEEKESKYTQIKKVRRYFFVDAQSQDMKNMDPISAQKILLALSAIPKDVDNKLYFLAGGYSKYFESYPFTCQVKADLDNLGDNASQTEKEKVLLYPFCRFPTQIIPGKLYLGNIYSSNSEKQLQDLKIKSLVDFIEYKQDQDTQNPKNPIPTFKNDSSKYNYLQLPFNSQIPVNINFDIINQQIDKMVQQGTTLLYCENGQSLSAAFAIAYLMYKNSLDISMASLKVCQAIARTEITKWIYTQLLVYKPKKQQK